MSHQPHVFYNYDIDGQVAFVKNANYNELVLYEFNTSLALRKWQQYVYNVIVNHICNIIVFFIITIFYYS